MTHSMLISIVDSGRSTINDSPSTLAPPNQRLDLTRGIGVGRSNCRKLQMTTFSESPLLIVEYVVPVSEPMLAQSHISGTIRLP